MCVAANKKTSEKLWFFSSKKDWNDICTNIEYIRSLDKLLRGCLASNLSTKYVIVQSIPDRIDNFKKGTKGDRKLSLSPTLRYTEYVLKDGELWKRTTDYFTNTINLFLDRSVTLKSAAIEEIEESLWNAKERFFSLKFCFLLGINTHQGSFNRC